MLLTFTTRHIPHGLPHIDPTILTPNLTILAGEMSSPGIIVTSGISVVAATADPTV